MKKFALTLIACLAFVQSHAATSALTESLLEFEAITEAIGTNPAFMDVIPPNEFIIDISRITPEVDVLGTVEYEIVTRIISDNGSGPNLSVDMHESSHHRKHCHDHNNHANTHKYIAVLNITPNPGIGPNQVTVVSITPAFD